MAKNKTNNNDLFANFKIEKPKEKNIIAEKESEPTLIEEKIEPTKPIEEIKPVINDKPVHFDDMAFAMPRSGRPKTLEGKYHNFTARIREDLYEYALSCVGKDQPYQSVNDYINRLIARDMLSK